MQNTPISYRLIFVFSVVMFLLCFIGLYNKEQSAFGAVVWGYILWLMHKKNIQGLVTVFKYIFILTIILGVIGLLFVNNIEIGVIGYLFILFVGLIIQYSFWQYFAKFELKQSTAKNDKNPQPQINSNEEIWKRVYKEFDSSDRNLGIWAKCFADANGDESVAKANYLKVRVEELSKSDNKDSQTDFMTSDLDDLPQNTQSDNNKNNPKNTFQINEISLKYKDLLNRKK